MASSRVLTLGLVLLLPVAAQAQGGTTLDVPINTGLATSSPTPPASKATKAPARSGRSLPSIPRGSLASRGGGRTQEPSPAPMTVTVRPGTVIAESVAIRTTQALTSRVLSVVKRGQNLAVLRETEDQYGVLMVNNTMGWVPKEALELLDYNTQVALAPEPSRSTTPGNIDGLGERQQRVLREAFTYMGVPYVWAGNTRSGLDCSAFVKNVFSTIGVDLPRHSGHQISVGQTITSTAELVAGDRLYFAMKGGQTITHTGIYIGDGYFIHASSNHGRVDIDSLFKTNYINKLVAIRRD